MIKYIFVSPSLNQIIIMSVISVICKKRLLGDLRLLKKDPHQFIDVFPDEADLLTWYFLIKGPDESDYKNGYYIGKIMHNPEYPLKAPDFVMLTPSGRFMPDQKICMTNTGFHQSDWSPLWSVHAILTGFLSIMLDDKEHGISHIFNSKEERQMYANDSIQYNKTNFPKLVKQFTRFLDEKGDPVKDNPKQPVIEEKKESVKKVSNEKPKKINKRIIDADVLKMKEKPKSKGKANADYDNIMTEYKKKKRCQ